jgi:hypothetical protein
MKPGRTFGAYDNAPHPPLSPSYYIQTAFIGWGEGLRVRGISFSTNHYGICRLRQWRHELLTDQSTP